MRQINSRDHGDMGLRELMKRIKEEEFKTVDEINAGDLIRKQVT